MKKILVISILIYKSICIFSQDEEYPSYVSTTIPSNSRFEIIQSSLSAKFTFKVDKFTGDTYQLVIDNQNILSWNKIYRYKHELDIITNENKVNYQLFSSGIAGKHTFLINVDTGATWLFVVDNNGVNLWQAMY